MLHIRWPAGLPAATAASNICVKFPAPDRCPVGEHHLWRLHALLWHMFFSCWFSCSFKTMSVFFFFCKTLYKFTLGFKCFIWTIPDSNSVHVVFVSTFHPSCFWVWKYSWTLNKILSGGWSKTPFPVGCSDRWSGGRLTAVTALSLWRRRCQTTVMGQCLSPEPGARRARWEMSSCWPYWREDEADKP